MTNDFPDDETLLGFLLGGLEPADEERVRRAIAENPNLEERLNALRPWVELVHEGAEHFEPPAGLVDRTLASVASLEEEPNQLFGKASPQTPADRIELVWLRNSWMDVMIATAAAIVIMSLLAPGLLGSRELARREQCSNNLAGLGAALASFAEMDPSQRIPSIDPVGPLAFAGVYAIRLHDAGLLEGPEKVWCPSLLPSSPFQSWVPSSSHLLQANPDEVSHLQKLAGGTYAYNLGIIKDGKYATPSLASHSRLALLADAPMIRRKDDLFLVHSGRGFNLLYDDGRVAFVRLDEAYGLEDHPHRNHRGLRAAGVDETDSALGPSYLNARSIRPQATGQ